MIKRRLYKIDSEDALQADFFSWLKVHHVKYPVLRLFHSIPNGGFRHVSTAIRLKRTGTLAGIPDTHLPVARHGFFSLYIEFKTPKGVLTHAQREIIELLREQGNQVQICRSWVEAATLTIDYLGLQVKI